MSGSIVVMQTSTVPCSARSAGTCAVHSAPSTVAPWSPATTSYQYQPPSTNGLSGSVKVNDPESPSTVAASTRCALPRAIDL